MVRTFCIKIKARDFHSPVGKILEMEGNPRIMEGDYHLLKEKKNKLGQTVSIRNSQ